MGRVGISKLRFHKCRRHHTILCSPWWPGARICASLLYVQFADQYHTPLVSDYAAALVWPYTLCRVDLVIGQSYIGDRSDSFSGDAQFEPRPGHKLL